MMCKPMVSSRGEWILPVSLWKLTVKSAQIVGSTDHGKNWQVRGGCTVPDEVRSFDEHIIVERKDKSFWMLVRTKYGIGESVSTDNGQTWSQLLPSRIMHPCARFFILRLSSGNLLLVKHGPIDVQTERSQLMAFVSLDDGLSWSEGLLLEYRTGVSYPDGQQVDNHTIYIIYDFNRTAEQHILMVSFTESDVISKGMDAASPIQRYRVSNGGKGKD
jgi:predicted neuraminidase